MKAPIPAALQEILASHQGIVFADDHDNPAITAYLARRMEMLADAGIKVLFVEMFQNTPEQNAWLRHFNDGHDDRSRHEMENWLTKNWRHSPRETSDYRRLFEAARRNGIEVVGMEPEYRDCFDPIKSSNAAWKHTITSYLSKHPDVKYAVFGGRLHTHLANQLSGEHECDQATGIDKLLNIPCVTFTPAVRGDKDRLIAGSEPSNYCIALPQAASSEVMPARR